MYSPFRWKYFSKQFAIDIVKSEIARWRWCDPLQGGRAECTGRSCTPSTGGLKDLHFHFQFHFAMLWSNAGVSQSSPKVVQMEGGWGQQRKRRCLISYWNLLEFTFRTLLNDLTSMARFQWPQAKLEPHSFPWREVGKLWPSVTCSWLFVKVATEVEVKDCTSDYGRKTHRSTTTAFRKHNTFPHGELRRWQNIPKQFLEISLQNIP